MNLRFSQVFGIFDNLPGKANVRYFFLSERSLSKTGSEVIATLQLKKTQRCIHRILKILGFCEALMLRNAEVLQGIDVEKC